MTRNRVMTLCVVGVLGLAACGSSAGSSSAGPYATQKAATATSGAATASGTTLAVASTTSRGDVLVDGAGRTLYLFEKDSGTTSACTGGCVSVWPPLSGAGKISGSSGVDTTKLGNAHGQVTYNGHLLYYFSGDAVAGDMKGVDIDGWYPVTPTGGSAESK